METETIDEAEGVSARKAKNEFSEEVDILILDHLVHKATHSLLKFHEKRLLHNVDSIPRKTSEKIKERLSMVNEYLILRSPKHLTNNAPDLNFRLQLLQYFSLHTFWCQPDIPTGTIQSLAPLRLETKKHVQQYQARAKRILGNERQGFGICMHLAAGLDASSPESAQKDPEARPTLLDLIPAFIRLTIARGKLAHVHLTREMKSQAALQNGKRRKISPASQSQHENDWITSEAWLKLPLEMMLHAVLEQRSILGAQGATSVLDAFSWGPVHESDLFTDLRDNLNSEDSDNRKTRELNQAFMLASDDEGNANDASTWNELRIECIKQLIPPESSSPEGTKRHFERVAEQHPRQGLEQELYNFMFALFDTLPLPILEQIERSTETGVITVDGVNLDHGEIEALRRAYGLE